MGALSIKEGQKFGKLLVLSRWHKGDRFGHPMWFCLCDCGWTTSVPTNGLKRVNSSGKLVSCVNCTRPSYRPDKNPNGRAKKIARHGLSKTKAYASYAGMIRRCYNPQSEDYPNYGGRGITVCKRWLDSYEDFLSDVGDRPEGLTLDRVDTNGNYEPSNVRWASIKTQNRNRRKIGSLTYFSDSELIQECKRRGLLIESKT